VSVSPLPLRSSPFAGFSRESARERVHHAVTAGRSLGSSPCSVPRENQFPERSSRSLSLLSRVLRLWCRRPGLPLQATASHAVPSPSTFSCPWAATYLPGLPTSGLRCLLSVSHALKAFIRPRAAGLVSCRSRPWGSALQGRFPLAELCLLSKVIALLRLACPRLPLLRFIRLCGRSRVRHTIPDLP